MVMHTPCNLKEKFTSRIVTNSVAEADVSAVRSPATLFSIFFWGVQKNTTLLIAGTLERFQSHVGGHGSRQGKDRDLALCFISCTRYQLYSLKAVCAHRTLPPVFYYSLSALPLPPLLIYNEHETSTAIYLTSCTINQVNKVPSRTKHISARKLIKTFSDFNLFCYCWLHFFPPLICKTTEPVGYLPLK